MLFLLYRLLRTLGIYFSLLHNPYMDGVVPGKMMTQLPCTDGSFSKTSGDASIVVFLIGTRSNSALGVFDPAFKRVALDFRAMLAQIDSDAERMGCLGTSSYTAMSDRSVGNDILTVQYWDSLASLQRFANAPLHRETWTWFEKSIKGLEHVTIYHETYCVPRAQWENVYINSVPSKITGVQVKVPDFESESGESWVRPLVDAKGKKGLRDRMGMV